MPAGMSGADLPSAEHPERCYDRVTLLLAGRLCVGDAVIDVRVRNLSRGGVLLELVSPPPSGTAVSFESGKTGAVAGIIAWSAGTRCGVAFDVPASFDLSPRSVAARRPSQLDYHKRPALRAPAATGA